MVIMISLFIVLCLMIFCLRRYKKLQKETLGKARKSGAEGESLKLLKESGAFFRFERDILADGAQVIGRDAEKRAREKAASIKKMFLQSFIVFALMISSAKL